MLWTLKNNIAIFSTDLNLKILALIFILIGSNFRAIIGLQRSCKYGRDYYMPVTTIVPTKAAL